MWQQGEAGEKRSSAALFLMLRREWWLILWPNNGTATSLMLTGLHIHLNALGVEGRKREGSAQWFCLVLIILKRSLPAVCRELRPRPRGYIEKARVSHVRSHVVRDEAAVAKRREKKNAAGKKKRSSNAAQRPEELRYKWRESHRSRISTKPRLPPSLPPWPSTPPRNLRSRAKHEKWRMRWLHTQLPKGY